jgi:hypothetical protein
MNLRKPLMMTASLLLLLAGLSLPLAAQAETTKAGGGKNDAPNASAPDCGGGQPECFVDITIHEGGPTTGAICSSFTASSGFCLGPTTGTAAFSNPGYFPRQGIETAFTWDSPGGSRRDCDYTSNATFTIVDSRILGSVPDPGSAVFAVSDAWSRGSGAHYKTLSNAAPGLPGGPLYIDYESKFVGSYVHIFGYLVRK